jgi:hypothetical protein
VCNPPAPCPSLAPAAVIESKKEVKKTAPKRKAEVPEALPEASEAVAPKQVKKKIKGKKPTGPPDPPIPAYTRAVYTRITRGAPSATRPPRSGLCCGPGGAEVGGAKGSLARGAPSATRPPRSGLCYDRGGAEGGGAHEEGEKEEGARVEPAASPVVPPDVVDAHIQGRQQARKLPNPDTGR